MGITRSRREPTLAKNRKYLREQWTGNQSGYKKKYTPLIHSFSRKKIRWFVSFFPLDIAANTGLLLDWNLTAIYQQGYRRTEVIT